MLVSAHIAASVRTRIETSLLPPLTTVWRFTWSAWRRMRDSNSRGLAPITRRFKQLAAAAGLPEIDLHDVRHSYATAGRDAKIDWKALSHRIGHSDVAFTMKQYVQTDLEADRQVANTLAELIIGGSLTSFEITRDGSRGAA